ncbi:MAG: ergosterol biosynthesis protein, partial [Sclerophora amabilis]
VSLISVLNSVQTYVSISPTRQVYGAAPPSQITPLGARTFGTWTLISAIVRIRTAYAIDNPEAYALAFATFAVAGLHFYSEWLYFGTVRTPWAKGGKGKGSWGPLLVATGTSLWMANVWGGYVR